MSQRRAAITALGTYVPERVVTNADLMKLRRHLGRVDPHAHRDREAALRRARHRHQHDRGQGGAGSAAAARDRRGRARLIIVATVTPDMLFPATGCLVQDKIGAKRAWAFDVSAACSGFVYALTVGAQFVETGRHSKVTGDRRRRHDLDPGLPGPHHLRAVRRRRGRRAPGAARGRHRHPRLRARGRRLGRLLPEHAGRRQPQARDATRRSTRSCTTSGSRASTSSSTRCASSPTAARQILQRNDLTGSDVDLFVAHQANIRIIEAAQHRMGLPDAKVIKNIREYGNTTAATIPLALKTALDEKRLAPGHRVLLAAVGAGFTVRTVLLERRDLGLTASRRAGRGDAKRRSRRPRPVASPVDELVPGHAHGEHRARRAAHHALGGRAEERLVEHALAVGRRARSCPRRSRPRGG